MRALLEARRGSFIVRRCSHFSQRRRATLHCLSAHFLTATGELITQEGAYEMDGEVPEAAEGEEAELPPRKWVGVPVK